MDYKQWVREFRKHSGWSAAMCRASKVVLMMDWESGMSPEYSAYCYKLGYDPNGEAFKAAEKIVNAALTHF